MDKKEIVSFRDLLAWQAAHKLTVAVYKIFKNARFTNNNLRNQIERSSLSVSSNIAEGFGRNSRKDKEHFYIMARGSVYEVQAQLLLARDVGDISKESFEALYKLSVDSVKLLHGLIKSLRNNGQL